MRLTPLLVTLLLFSSFGTVSGFLQPAGEPLAMGGVQPGIAGAVTIIPLNPPTAGNDPDFRYHQGDTITFAGTNTMSGTTYLFLTGPNLKVNGSQIQSAYPPAAEVIEGDPFTFAAAAVGTDGRWTYAWDTKTTTLAPGTYTIYAVNGPHDRNHLANSSYGTTSVLLVKPGTPAIVRQESFTLEEEIRVHPSGPVQSGTPVTITATVHLPMGGKETFPYDHNLVLTTGLENPHWSYSLVLDGIENTRPVPPGAMLSLSGFELSYPGDLNEERVVVTLQGTAPVVREGITRNAIRIFVVGPDGNIVPNSTVVREITILPLTGTRPYDTPTTAPGMPGVPEPTTQKGSLGLVVAICGIVAGCGIVCRIRKQA
ncbi:hypothetical protein [Methanoregula sp.]|uniref:hypothetical protein n=1 Tax=Methanoregula sp. TaxID=2052170 RepID=UPI00260C2612|nr:hypothetical protein [Methanoregula sp.]MDD5142975.1 hypothetical protein [Methanoregula sp.]